MIAKYNAVGDYIDVENSGENVGSVASFLDTRDDSRSFVRIYNAKQIAEFILAKCREAKDGSHATIPDGCPVPDSGSRFPCDAGD